MAPSLTDPYALLTVPRVSDLELSQKVVILPISSPNTSHLEIGISRSSISSYILKPSPKLVWSFSLPPTCLILCLNTLELDDGSKIYAAGIADRGRKSVLIVHKSDEKTTEHRIQVKYNVIGVKFHGSDLIVLYENGSIDLFDYENGSFLKNAFINREDTLYYKFISKREFKSEEDLLLIITKSKIHITFKLISLDAKEYIEIDSGHLDRKGTPLKAYKPGMFAYNSRYVYVLDSEKKILSAVAFNGFQVQKSISIENYLDSQNTYIFAPSADRVLLSAGSSIHLINFKFECCLGSFYGQGDACLKDAVSVNGNSMNSSRTIAIYLEQPDLDVSLNIINVDVGLNKLSECLGKSIEKDSTHVKGLPNLLDDNFEDEAINLTKEVNEILGNLENIRKVKNLSKWERIVTPYLKGESWSKINTSLNKNKSKKTVEYKFQVFDLENDRVVDPAFISEILLLIFTSNEGKVKPKDEDFLPEHSLIYLLTCPLFPTMWVNGLLEVFHSLDCQTLLRQAILTCPGIPLEDLLCQFVMAPTDDKIFEDLLGRLVNDFSVKEITLAFKDLMHKRGEVNLEAILNSLVLANTSNSWCIIESVIDAGGLFNWSIDTVNKLEGLIDLKLNTLATNNFNLTLANQALLINEPMKKKLSKSKKKKSADIVSANEHQLQQLDSILFLNNTSSKKLIDHQSTNASVYKHTPTYSLEKLVL
ncbi:uncharacterized protein PRCAT00002297001 [Priceomyces carsonii]|uniref:uncharacterized protein n=1 Tax=Priceomyces carsonii TaxID=28549 RepID=UPI002ED987DA|nr:unnamed protein product [Priceomyces carsonii]